MKNFSNMFPFTKENVQRNVPLTSGVYRLIYKTGDKYYVFYVGQSDNLQRRLLEHLSSSEENLCIKRYLKDYECFYRFIEISSSEERNRVEREQINEYNPNCNS